MIKHRWQIVTIKKGILSVTLSYGRDYNSYVSLDLNANLTVTKIHIPDSMPAQVVLEYKNRLERAPFVYPVTADFKEYYDKILVPLYADLETYKRECKGILAKELPDDNT